MKKYFISILMFGFVGWLHAEGDHMLQLRVDPAYLSPNNDDLQDQAFFYPVLKSNVAISHWTLDISSAKPSRRVARLTGKSLPALIKWDGFDKKGISAQDGLYLARLKAVGKRTFVAEQSFVVDTVPPLVALSISTPVFDRSFLENGQLTLKPEVNDASPLDRWLLQVADVNGRTVYVHWSSGTVRDVDWNGTDQATHVLVPQGDYRVIFQAWDKAGNESVPTFINLKVNVTPREMLERALHRIRVNQSSLGLIVQLGARSLFRTKLNQIELTEEGEQLLSEAAILANAYPDVSIVLDGYSRSKKEASQDRALASLYAWRVYSSLTKVGNVKPSRLTVRSRGRAVLPERRAAGVPLIRNGVEIILEGDGPW